MLTERLHRLTRHFGFDFYRVANYRPTIYGSTRVSGSFPPLTSHGEIGPSDNYYIHSGYSSRFQNDFFDDMSNEGQWQQEVYRYAAELAADLRLTTVCDVGCGSGFKLLKYLGHLDTIGVDTEQTVQLLRAKYPERVWHAGFSTQPAEAIDLAIASDVIEHLPDPDELMRYLGRLRPKRILLSTPDRDLLRAGTYNGPPANPAHVREWNFAEFRAYVASYFELDEHFISFAAQCTQCVLCHPR